MAPARADERLYTLGATLERLLEEKWGHTLLSQAPNLTPTEMFAATEGAV
jgi:aspartyl-tRNA(Asn)/glutamyl-tRNA(Gln) amidotransferase subunit A